MPLIRSARARGSMFKIITSHALNPNRHFAALNSHLLIFIFNPTQKMCSFYVVLFDYAICTWRSIFFSVGLYNYVFVLDKKGGIPKIMHV
jgi:hypothetical protein